MKEQFNIVQLTIESNSADQVKIATSDLSDKAATPTTTNSANLDTTLNTIKTLDIRLNLIASQMEIDKLILEARITQLQESAKLWDTYLIISYIKKDEHTDNYVTRTFHDGTVYILTTQLSALEDSVQAITTKSTYHINPPAFATITRNFTSNAHQD